MVAPVSCGGHSAATQLTIEVGHGSVVSAYRLTCDPPAGNAPDPAAICRQLAHRSELLVGGPGIWHSCPAMPNPTAVRVLGTYRGHAVYAVFSGTGCGWVPGQAGALAEWSTLMVHAGPGRRTEGQVSAPNQRGEPKRAQQRILELHRLVRKREASGSTALDGPAVAIIRKQTELGVLEGGPLPNEVDVYTTPRHTFLVVTHFEYRDYAGHTHRATDGVLWSVLDPRTFAATSDGIGPMPEPRPVGPRVTLRF